MASSVFLSILIPVYNWNISELLVCLSSQIEKLVDGECVEIVVLDDDSSEKFNNKETADQLMQVSYQELPENHGRAAIRNLLLQKAVGKYVLFLDADMLPDHDGFLQRYISQAIRGREIVCGGISYLQCEKEERFSFYLYKSSQTEALPVAVREKAPWRYLFTSNILLLREIVQSVSFDPGFSGYGFEDIEWGIRLSKTHTILHINNSCSHMGLMEKNEVYLKMREAIPNYGLLLSLHPECMSQMGAGVLASCLRVFPNFFLKFSDNLLSFLYHSLTLNKLLLLIFQLDKAVLLAIFLKNSDPGKNDLQDV